MVTVRGELTSLRGHFSARTIILDCRWMAVSCGSVLLGLSIAAAATPCELGLSVLAEDGVVYPNGSLVHRHGVYPQGHYFTVNGTVRSCPCKMKPCIRKCCLEDEEFFVYRPNKKTRPRLMCKKLSTVSAFVNFSLPVYKRASEAIQVPRDHFGIVFGEVCPGTKLWLDHSKRSHDKNFLMSNGSVLIFGADSQQIFLDVTSYCLESVNTSRGIYTFICAPPSPLEVAVKYVFYPIGMFLSMPFLLATFVVYAILPDLRNVHGKSLMCNIASLISAYVSLAAIQLNRNLLNHKGYVWCSLLGKFMETLIFLNVN